MDKNPSTKQSVDRFLKSEEFIVLTCGSALFQLEFRIGEVGF